MRNNDVRYSKRDLWLGIASVAVIFTCGWVVGAAVTVLIWRDTL